MLSSTHAHVALPAILKKSGCTAYEQCPQAGTVPQKELRLGSEPGLERAVELGLQTAGEQLRYRAFPTHLVTAQLPLGITATSSAPARGEARSGSRAGTKRASGNRKQVHKITL